MAAQFTDENFEKEVLQSKIPVLVDFYADWCGPCQMLGPIIEELAHEYEGKVKIGKLNVDEGPTVAQNFGIMSIPALIVFNGGQPVNKMVGFKSKDALKQVLDSL